MVDVMKILEDTGAVMNGHFLLTSGLHSPRYVEKFRLLQYPDHTAPLCDMVADHFKGIEIHSVAGPTLGGVILAYEVARALKVRSIYAEREGDSRVFRRGLSLNPGEKVLVVDDILTTGGSVKEVVEAVRAEGAIPAAVGVLVDRSGGQVHFEVPFFSCLQLAIPAYRTEACPQCAQGVPLIKPGGAPDR